MRKKIKKNDHKATEGNSRKRKRAAKVSVLAILVLVAVFLISAGGYSIAFASKVYSNIKLGGVNYGGASKVELNDKIKARSEEFLNQKFTLIYKQEGTEDKKYEIGPSDIGLVFDADKTVGDIYAYGRQGNIWQEFKEQLLSLLKPHEIAASYTINTEALDKSVAAIAAETDVPEKDFQIAYEAGGKFKLLSDKQTGKRIDQTGLASNIKSQISKIKINDIAFSTQTYEPKVTETNAQIALRSANKILAAGELKLVYSDLSFTLDVDTIAGLIKSRPKGDNLELYIDGAKVTTQVQGIAQNVNRPAKNATLAANNGVVTAFQISEEGRELDQNQTIVNVGNALLARSTDGVTTVDTETVKLPVKATQPEVSSASLDKYGLKELVATGMTDFRNSPANRVHNITVGAAAINGTLLKPGEEFSTLSKLGAIDASTGYLPELVIKDNKTVPDYGGGLCQVSTTLFRTALNSGMEITSRYNHSYRVSYYEPPVGMDATIYSPAPDFKFKNNYSSYILIQSRVVGSKITFDFFGTKDTRVVEVGVPAVSSYQEPPPPVETLTDTLPAGERQLVSHAHQWANASFHYKVVRDGVTLQEKDFASKYQAWAEKWLVGTGGVTPPTTDPAAAATAPPA